MPLICNPQQLAQPRDGKGCWYPFACLKRIREIPVQSTITRIKFQSKWKQRGRSTGSGWKHCQTDDNISEPTLAFDGISAAFMTSIFLSFAVCTSCATRNVHWEKSLPALCWYPGPAETHGQPTNYSQDFSIPQSMLRHLWKWSFSLQCLYTGSSNTKRLYFQVIQEKFP